MSPPSPPKAGILPINLHPSICIPLCGERPAISCDAGGRRTGRGGRRLQSTPPATRQIVTFHRMTTTQGSVAATRSWRYDNQFRVHRHGNLVERISLGSPATQALAATRSWVSGQISSRSNWSFASATHHGCICGSSPLQHRARISCFGSPYMTGCAHDLQSTNLYLDVV